MPRSVEGMIRHLSRGALVFDASIALVSVAFRVLVGIDTAPLWAVVVGFGVAFALRRLSPALALSIAWVAAVAQIAFLLPVDAVNLVILPVLFATARYGTARVRFLGLVSVFCGSLLGSVYLAGFYWSPVGIVDWWTFDWSFSSATLNNLAVAFVGMLALLGLSWTAGLLARTQAVARESRVARLVAEEAAAVELERNQIARDMHDVVAHSLAVVIAQADGARYAAATDPGSVDSALSTIAVTARESLSDVRLLLAQLRHSQNEGPQPGLADVSSLVEQVRSAGLLVEVVERGVSVVIPPGQQIALYRIAQEALTNALRHGVLSEPALLSLVWGESDVTVSVTNRIRSSETAVEPRGGHGLVGMRERALLTAAELHAAPEGDHFVVRVRMPVVR